MSNSSPSAAASIPSSRIGGVLFALAMGAFVLGTTEFASMSLLPQIAKAFGVTEPVAGHAISAYALGVVVGSPVITVLAAKLPRRALLIGLVCLIGAGNGLSAVAPSMSWFLVFRFISGLPHGAYFGVAALLAASLVPQKKRAQAVSRMILGLTVATIVGVPFATSVGQTLGWRWGLGIVAMLAVITMLLIRTLSPNPAVPKDASPLRELGALRNRQVWLTLGIGAVGFGGLFCTYTYLASTLIDITHANAATIPLVFGIFGIGSTVGTLACGWAADKSTMRAGGIVLALGAVILVLYPSAVGNIRALSILTFFIGCGVGLSTILQTRLMDVAGDAQALAGALMQSSFNVANAIGPWVGGLVISSGLGLENIGYAGAALSLGGLAMWIWTVLDARSSRRRVAESIG